MKRVLDEVVTIDAGGTLFKTTRQTLDNAELLFPNSVLGQALESTFVDTDPALFRHLLQLLRRPTVSPTVPPPDFTAEVWHAELDYWGLGERLLSKEQRETAVRQRGLTELETLGADIRRQIERNEVEAVRALLDHSGYSAARDKVRAKVLMVPLGQYALESGLDLGHFINDNAVVVEKLLKHILGDDTTVRIHKATPVKNFEQYQFAGQTYSNRDTETLNVSINFGGGEKRKKINHIAV